MENNEQDFYKALCETLEFVEPKLWNIVKRYQKKDSDKIKVLDDLLLYRDKKLNSPSQSNTQENESDNIESAPVEDEKRFKFIEFQGDIYSVDQINNIKKESTFSMKHSRVLHYITINKDTRDHPMPLANISYEFFNEEKRDEALECLKYQLSVATKNSVLFF